MQIPRTRAAVLVRVIGGVYNVSGSPAVRKHLWHLGEDDLRETHPHYLWDRRLLRLRSVGK